MTGGLQRSIHGESQVSVITHAILAAVLIATFIWIVPEFARECGDHISDLPVPYPFLAACGIANLIRHTFAFVLPSLVLLLWLDFRFCGVLAGRARHIALAVWSLTITAILAALLFWLFYALSRSLPEI